MYELKNVKSIDVTGIKAVNGCNLDYLRSWLNSLGCIASIEGNMVVWHWRTKPEVVYHASSFTEAREKLGFPKW